MADNKNQHFVPKLYLRNFSSDKKSINLFNLKLERKIFAAPLKNQCSRDYFYGKNLDQEKKLSAFEGTAATALLKLNETKIIPNKNDRDHQTILLYLTLQSFRTGLRVDALNEMIETYIKYILKQEYPNDDLSKLKIGMKSTSNFAVNSAQTSFVFLYNMNWLLVSLAEDQELITSDNPVVFFNPFISSGVGLGTAGLGVKGLVCFFPINPKFALILYDPAVYETDNTSKQTYLFENVKKSDIDQLNIVQCANADENIYFFQDDLNVAEIVDQAKKVRPRNRNIQHIFVTADTNVERRELLTAGQAVIDFHLSLSFLKMREDALLWRTEFLALKERPPFVQRDLWLHAVVSEYHKRQLDGESLPSIVEYLRYRARQETEDEAISKTNSGLRS